MPLDDSFWMPFRQAKAAFLTALLDRHQSLSTRAPAAPCWPRRAVRAQVDEFISSLGELEDELDNVQRDIQRVRNSLSQQKAVALTSLQPIGMLLPEIIREIVPHTVEGPSAHRQIMRLSQVSKPWRDVVLGISALFTEARWGIWPFALVELWCSRAGPRLLNIRVTGAFLLRMASAPGRPYQELLKKHAVQMGILEFSCYGARDPNTSGLLDLRMPSLQCLIIRGFTGSPVSACIRFENMPKLRRLGLLMTTPEIPAPLTNVTSLHYGNYAHALQRDMLQIFPKLPRLRHLSLELLVESGTPTSPGPRNVLQSLISLEVRWGTSPDSTLLPSLSPLNLSSLPNLQTIVLHDDGREFTALFQSLALQVPHLKSLYFVFVTHYEDKGWLRFLPILTPTESTTAIFPNLQDAVFLYTGHDRLKCTDEHHKLLRDFVLARKGVLTRLSIPSMENMDILHPLKDHIAHFEVSKCARSPMFF